MIISENCTINVLLTLVLALASAISDDHKWRHNLVGHLLTTLCKLDQFIIAQYELFWNGLAYK